MSQEQKHDSPGQHKEIEIIVNGRQVVVTERELSFIQVVRLAFENATINDTTIYTVTYKRGEGNRPEGTMVNGDVVKVKAGMIFNVFATNKS